MSDERYETGMRVRRAVLGDAHVERSERAKDDFTRDFQRFITETAWGSVWSRAGLDTKTRSMVTIALLAALGRYDELRLHVRATKQTGVSQAEVAELLMHAAVYAGIPAANSAFHHAAEAYADLAKEFENGAAAPASNND
ncbi:MAG: 4-carboxymuconolactone decarboxylase [Candidatus Eremiobacteraeota bacterium]|nr:4-carboxymuconolactone decarboxylase [Candidatus Eremiobacteraeota bacterium]